MPRYFFNVVEGETRTLLRDSEGILLSDSTEARNEALGWARDFARHNFHESIRSWKVVVIDENAAVLLTIPLSEARPRKLTRAWLKCGRRISKTGSRFRSEVLALLLTGTILVVLVQAGRKVTLDGELGGSYELTSASSKNANVAVRFIPNASLLDITNFLSAYNAALVDDAGPGGLYKLRLRKASLSQNDIEEIIGRMTHEKVVEFVAAMQ